MLAAILLVEGEAAVRNVTREALEMGSYHVLAADGPIAATASARDESKAIDLLLTDVVMPGMNDPELVRLVRELRPESMTLFMPVMQTPRFFAWWRWKVRTSTFRSRSQCTACWPA